MGPRLALTLVGSNVTGAATEEVQMLHSQSIKVGRITEPHDLAGEWLVSYGGEQYVIDQDGGQQRAIPTDKHISTFPILRRSEEKRPTLKGVDPVDADDLVQILAKSTTLDLQTIISDPTPPTFPKPMAVFQDGKVPIWSLEKVERWRADKGI
jgi:hypothetical protein